MKIAFKFKSYFKKPQNIILVVMLVVLGYLTLFPMFSMIKDTLTVHVSEARRLKLSVGAFTFDHWVKVLFDKNSLQLFYRPFINSLVTSLAACLVSLVFGGTFAWFITRTNLRWKKLLSSLFIFPYIMPSWTLALAWINIFKNSLTGWPTAHSLSHLSQDSTMPRSHTS